MMQLRNLVGAIHWGRGMNALLLAVALLLFLPQLTPEAAGATPQIRSLTHQGRTYYRALDVGKVLGLKLSSSGSKFELRNTSCRFVFNSQKRYGSFNNTVLTYSFAPVILSGNCYVSENDYRNFLLPLAGGTGGVSRIGITTIMLDPGHGGSDGGARGKTTQEKTLTLQVALRTKALLERAGYRVMMTRTGDKTVSLDSRPALANRNKVSLFVSIHMNSATNSSVSGIETFALTPVGAPSSGSSTVSGTRHNGDRAIGNSTLLAYQIQSALVKATQGGDRGVKRARFVVLKECYAPSVLIECGFLSNTAEERKLATASYREKIAAAIVSGIRSYHQKVKK